MLTNILLLMFVIVEFGIAFLQWFKQSSLVKEKAYIRIGESIVWLLLILSTLIQWSFRWYAISIWLGIVTVIAVIRFFKYDRKKEVTRYRSRLKCALKAILSGVLINLALIPAMLFPQNYEIEPDGEYRIKTVSYTWTDLEREEYFTEEIDHRNITVQFWYPSESSQNGNTESVKFPLVIFSHGAFGVRESNFSTYQKLASHGYVVCSIDHTYHAFVTTQTDGKSIMANQEFMNQAMSLGMQEDSLEKYEITKGWQKLRVEDMRFCLNQIKTFALELQDQKGNEMNPIDEVFGMIDIDNIGVMGHSLGGSAAAEIGRTEEGIKAVAILDGTMLGEEIGFKDGKEMITNEPYPVPMLNFYNGAAYDEIEALDYEYANCIASKSQPESYEIVIENAGHMNFTDLPLISPTLAKLLGSGEVDERACMVFVNETVLEFFDGYLKGQDIDLDKKQTICI